MQDLTITNNLNNNLTIENEQKNFLETTLGKTINTGLDIGIRYLLPDFIENQVIDIKDAIMENGFKEGVKQVIDSTIDLGKSTLGIFTGNFENVGQVQTVIKNGGLLESVSGLINTAVDRGISAGKINNSVGAIIKKGKNVIVSNISKNLENEFERQLDSVEKLSKYSNNWRECYNNKDFEGMEREFKKMKEKFKEILPMENTIKEARTIENLHTLIKNNGRNFDLSEEQKELANILK